MENQQQSGCKIEQQVGAELHWWWFAKQQQVLQSSNRLWSRFCTNLQQVAFHHSPADQSQNCLKKCATGYWTIWGKSSIKKPAKIRELPKIGLQHWVKACFLEQMQQAVILNQIYLGCIKHAIMHALYGVALQQSEAGWHWPN